MKLIEFHPEANDEARTAAAYYEGIQAGLGVDFGAELSAALSIIGNNPLIYAAESEAMRVCPLRRFPYSIFYEDLGDRVWVAAIGHHRRRPGFWRRRRPS